MRRDALWIVLAAALITGVIWWFFLSPRGDPTAEAGGPGTAVTMPRSELKPDSDPPRHAELMYIAPPLIPVEVKTERRGTEFTINLYDHGELFDFEKYASDENVFAVVQAAGEEYVPPIPVLSFPLNVGGPPMSWSGTLSSELSPHRATAKVKIWADKVAVGDRAVSTIRSDVDISIDAHDRVPATLRRLSFWFQPGRGLIKREFGTTSAREPAGSRE